MKGPVILLVTTALLSLLTANRLRPNSEYVAELTDIPIGKFISDRCIEVGFQPKDPNGLPVNASSLFDWNENSSISFETLKHLSLFLSNKDGKIPYPCGEIYLMNGRAGEQANRIKKLQIEVKSNGASATWIFELQDTLQYQRLRFPTPVFFGRNSELRLRPIELFPNSVYGEISELAIEFD